MLVEGVRAVREVLDAGAAIRFAVVSPRLDDTLDGGVLRRRLEESRADVVAATDAELAELAETETPQGVLLVAEEPRPDLTALARSGRILVLDAVQDPGNVGTLVRAAVAFALDGVVALDGTVDPWSAKAVRASAGTVFRLPVASATWGEARAAFESAGVGLIVAEVGGTPVAELAAPDVFALVLGNEGAGPRAQITAAAHATVTVPMPGAAESLNVGMAGTVLLYELTRERE